MKKVLSILLSLLMLIAMFHFNVAEHYCHGNLAASKVSLSEKLASCGMEDEAMDNSVSGIILKSHCCDDIVTSVGINNDYAPSYSLIPLLFQNSIQILGISTELPIIASAFSKSVYTNVSPPGVLMSTHVDLSDICVFRI